MSDVTVLGLIVPTTVLEDIGMDVPHGALVTIPADKAYRSRDLWRAISQRQVFRMTPGPLPAKPFNHVAVEAAKADQAAALENENRKLKEQMGIQQKEFERALQEQNDKLNSILSLLQSGVSVAHMPGMVGAPQPAVRLPKEEAVVGDVPTFIPTTITPENAQARIGSKKEESENASISDAASKLRQLRQKRGGQ